MSKKTFISNAIPYVNGEPHLGHALEFIETDCLARYFRQRGQQVHYQSGSDENSLKNVQAAEVLGWPVQEIVDQFAGRFEQLKEKLDLSYNDFIRTSLDPRHKPGVHQLWQACNAKGDIYRKPYGGLYCVGCEQFYQEEELVEGLCPEHLKPPEWVEEDNYFFRLSNYQDRLFELIDQDQIKIVPRKWKKSVLNFIAKGLDDFSISRSYDRARGWGIPVPGDSGQVIYVWFDALINYITALGYGRDQAAFEHNWGAADQRIHVIGKGITRFHLIYWPAILLSADIPLPTHVYVHAYVTVDGLKFSKSLGNAINPHDIADQYKAATVRHYLLHEISSVDDGDFTEERLQQAHNAQLANQLGNLLSRTLKLIERHCGGRVPPPLDSPDSQTYEDQILLQQGTDLFKKIETQFERFELHQASRQIWEYVAAINQYFAQQRPWEIAKRLKLEENEDDRQRLNTILYVTAEATRRATHTLWPFLPTTCEQVHHRLGVEAVQLDRPLKTHGPSATFTGPIDNKGILFPKFQ